MRDRKLLTPHEAEIDRLLQIMAVLIDKLGGEVIVSRRDLELFFDVPVKSRVISEDYVLLHVAYPDDEALASDVDLPEENPQV